MVRTGLDAQQEALGERVPIVAGGLQLAVGGGDVAGGFGARGDLVLVVVVIALLDFDQRLDFGIVVAIITALIVGG